MNTRYSASPAQPPPLKGRIYPFSARGFALCFRQERNERQGFRKTGKGRAKTSVPGALRRTDRAETLCQRAVTAERTGNSGPKKMRRKSGPETEAETVAATLFRKRGPGNWGKTRRKSEAATSSVITAPLRTPPPSRLFRKETVEG